MTAVESTALLQCEQVIERGLGTFTEVGQALLRIRDERLYRAEHGTFEDYCSQRWLMTRQHANRLVSAAEIAAVVEPVGSIANEAQARELSGLEPEVQREVFAAAAEATDGKPTASAIREAREVIAPRPAPISKVTHTTTDKTVEETVVDTSTGVVLTGDEWKQQNPGPSVAEYLDDDDAKDRAYMRAFLAALSKASEITTFDPERVGPLLTELELPSVQSLGPRVNSFITRAERARSGLRVITGGQQ